MEKTLFEVLVEPVAGAGVTVRGYTDCRAYTIIGVSPSGSFIMLQRDKVTLINGFDSGEPDALIMHPGGFAGHVEGVQRWSYERDVRGCTIKATRRKNGAYGTVGSSKPNIILGVRHEHYDYNF